MLIIPVPMMLRQEDPELEVRLEYVARPVQKLNTLQCVAITWIINLHSIFALENKLFH